MPIASSGATQPPRPRFLPAVVPATVAIKNLFLTSFRGIVRFASRVPRQWFFASAVLIHLVDMLSVATRRPTGHRDREPHPVSLALVSGRPSRHCAAREENFPQYSENASIRCASCETQLLNDCAMRAGATRRR